MPPPMPGRFVPPGDPYHRGGPNGQGHQNGHLQNGHSPNGHPHNGHPHNGQQHNGYPPNPPPQSRNGAGRFPPYGYRPPAAPPPPPAPNGARGHWPPPAGPVNGQANGQINGGSSYPQSVRRYSESYPPHGYAPKSQAEPRSYVPSRPSAPHTPPRSAPDLPSRPNTPPAARPSSGQNPNEYDGPSRRSFTPVQDYLAGADVIGDRARSGAGKAAPGQHSRSQGPHSHDSQLQESRVQDPYRRDAHLNGHAMPSNPLPLADDYSARALAELAQALESATEQSAHDRNVRTADAGVALLELDGSRGDQDQSWIGDTITPETLESLLGRSELDEPLVADDALMEKNSINPRSPRAALEPERVPQPQRRSKRARHPLVVAGNAVFTVLIVLALITGGVFVFGKQRFEAAGPLESDKLVTIPKGLGIRDISELLVQEGVIEQPWWVFMGGVFLLKARDGLKAGEYQFTKHASLHDVIATIVDGKVIQHQFTLPEGLTSEQIVGRILETDLLTGNIREVPHEGTLLPESYKLVRGTSREQLIQRMQQAQRRTLQEVWDHRMPDLPVKSPEQLVTLASIVERETGRPEERSRVAAVFINRLKQHMRLQSDPTIIYGLVGGKGSLGRPITRADIEQPTPYNTYVIDGLPPGPIANPGRASLEAVANPARTKEIFFVADGTGGHAFAETLEQHNRNVAHLRQIEQQQQQSPWSSIPAPSGPANTGGPAKPRAAATKPAATQ
jgi:UPF0755 protein